LYRLLFRELFEFRFFNSDPNFANYLYLPATGQLGLLDFGGVRELSPNLSASYARLFRAGMAGDRGALQAAMQDIGFFPADERDDRVTALVDLFLIGCEPFRHRGAYDFAASGLPVRARSAGFELTFRRGFHRPPPPDTVFLHRKLAGMFLLCAQLGARVDVRGMLQPFVDGAPAVSTIVERA
jgi:predicted unusual protein kinase regulating ubiquinone biosynthesis (AarF/ABC1/UbiB family)